MKNMVRLRWKKGGEEILHAKEKCGSRACVFWARIDYEID